MFKRIFFIILVIVSSNSNAISQADSIIVENQSSSKIEQTDQSDDAMTPIQKGDDEDIFTSDREFELSLWILLFGFLVVALETIIIIVIYQRNQAVGDEPYIVGPNVSKLIGVTLIIISALILITSGFTGKEIAPIVGLLGTVAGYLLGKSSDAKPPAVKPPEPASVKP